MTLEQYKLIAKAVNDDLTAALAKHGLKLGKLSARIEGATGTVRYSLEATDTNLKDANGASTTPEVERYKALGGLLGLKPEWLGQSIKMGPRTYKLAGLRDTRGNKCVCIDRDDGKRFICTPEDIVLRLGGGGRSAA